MDEQITSVASENGLDISALDLADKETRSVLKDFRTSLPKMLATEDHPGIDVVLCGSFARMDSTRESDCDFLVIVRGAVDHSSVTSFMRAMEQIREEKNLEKPGQQGIFGDFVTAQELLGRIGLDADSNITTTRRLLILTESVSVYAPDIRSAVIDGLLQRYCADYDSVNRSGDDHIFVPRFLLNDLVRFWRTMAVDFGAKRWRSIQGDWFLRYAKLVTTRKILFAGSLSALFLTDLVLREHQADAPDQHGKLILHLKSHFDKTPLARLLSSYDHVDDESKQSLVAILRAYNRFIEIMNTRGSRNILKKDVDEADSKSQQLREEIDGIAESIQDGLEQIFFKDQLFQQLTQRYGLF